MGCLRGSEEFRSTGYSSGDRSIFFGVYHSKAGIDRSLSGVGEAGEVRVVVWPSCPLSELSELDVEDVSSSEEEEEHWGSGFGQVLLILSSGAKCFVWAAPSCLYRSFSLDIVG